MNSFVDSYAHQIASTIRKNIRLLRINKELTQQQAANKADMERVTWVEIENGRNYPSVQTLVRVADVLRVEAHELFNPKTHKRLESMGVRSDRRIR